MKKLTAKSPYARISVAEEDVDDEHTNGNGHGGPHTASPTITRAHLGNGTHAIADDALTLEVDGMMCGHCVSTVHAALVGVPGVASADVDLDGGRATVRGTAAAAALIAACDAAGHPARLAGGGPIVLAVDDMMCSNCTGKVHGALVALPGVASADVVLDDGGRATVHGTASAEELIAAVEATGHAARLAAAPSLEGTVRVNGGGGGPGAPLTPAAEPSKNGTPSHPAYGSSWTPHGSPLLDRLTASFKRRGGDGEVALLMIEGMTCNSCVASVEGRLGTVVGVMSCSVSLLESKGKVRYDPALVQPAQLVDAIESAGFGGTYMGSMDTATATSPAEALHKEMRGWRAQFGGSLAFTLPVVFLSLILPHTDLHLKKRLNVDVIPGVTCKLLLVWLLVTPIQFGFGARFYRRAYKSLKHGSANMDVLVALGTSAAYFYSVVFTVLSITTGGDEGREQTCFETSAMLITFILLGKWLETSVKGKASEAISKLITLQPPTALRCDGKWGDGTGEGEDGDDTAANAALVDAEPVEVDVSKLRVGDVVKVLPGAQIPIDGVVVRGASTVDESMLTGEALPVSKAAGAAAVGGTINGSGVLWVRVNALGSETVLAKVMKVVSDAQLRKPQVQAFADRVSGYFVPCVITLALLVWIVWAYVIAYHLLPAELVDHDPSSMHPSGQMLAFMFGCAVLVIACPCAMGLATPTAVMVGSGVGASNGVLFRGGDVLERAAQVTAVVFDKTGTLTTGRLSVSEVRVWASSLTAPQFLALVGSAERGSEHPVGRAIAAHARARGAALVEPAAFTAAPGQGLACEVGGVGVLVGNRGWLAKHSLELDASQEAEVASLEERGHTAVLVARRSVPSGDSDGAAGRELVGMIAVADALKPEAAAVVALLRSWKLQVWLCSGDNERTARYIARQAGIADGRVVAGVKPAGKGEMVKRLQKEDGLVVAMVGDGINDAPALAQADLGVAVGSGTDVAIETADVVLIKSHLRDVATALRLSAVVMRRIWLNFVWAFGYNLIGIPLAAGVLYPVWKIHLPPMFAGATMSLSSILVVCSSIHLKCFAPPKLPIIGGARNVVPL